MDLIEKGKTKIAWSIFKVQDTDDCENFGLRIKPNHKGKISTSAKSALIKADGLLTDQKAKFFLKTADCIPIIIWWENSNWAGLLHLGYKELLKKLVKNLDEATKKINLDIAEANFILGPAICRKCYTHDSLLRKLKWLVLKFKYPDFSFFDNKNYTFDLTKVFLKELELVGVKKEKVKVLNYCTNCDLNSSRHRGTKKSDIITIIDTQV